ncbi:hypothetical protein O181_063369 [Austropuccinia psidii MF-1]|uniref:Uncharacterized protein n=1 Tax=Austropuccinia psidii MF-1 TaxID=1389203 RepID=A0A9Q3EMB4_9BASI|nr:hypothetical protein [Austropuccinia psidii MF-1]
MQMVIGELIPYIKQQYQVSLAGEIEPYIFAIKEKKTGYHSTTESWYKSLGDATKATTFLINFINETQLTSSSLDSVLLNGNEGAIYLAPKNSNHIGFKTKHIEIKFHFIKELLKKDILLLKNILTTSMNAYALTKSICKKFP